MRYLSLRNVAHLAVLLGSIVNLVIADEGDMAIWEPTCPDKKNHKEQTGSTKDCQDAIDSIRGISGGMGGKDGCQEVAKKGGCSITMCLQDNIHTTVSYQAIAVAAQNMHAICKGNPSDHRTGGFCIVEGWQQPGEAHSKARLYLGTTSGIPGQRRDAPSLRIKGRAVPERVDSEDVNITTRSILENEAPKELMQARADDDSLSIEAGGFKLKREFSAIVGNPSAHELPHDGSDALTGGLLYEWNGHADDVELVDVTTHHEVHEADRGTTEWTLTAYAHNNGDIGNNNIPWARRGSILDAFWTLRARNGNPANFGVAIDNAHGQTIGHITLAELFRHSIQGAPPIFPIIFQFHGSGVL